MKTLLILPLLMLTMTALAQPATSKATFSTPTYTLEYPESWRVDTSRLMGTDLLLFSPLEDSSDIFRENVNLIVQKLPDQTMTLESYKQLTEQQVAQIVTDSKLLASKITGATGKERYEFECEMTQGKFRLRVTSICYIKDSKAYLLTFTAELHKYEAYKTPGDQVLESFRLIR